MNSYAARTVYPCTVPYNIKLYTGLIPRCLTMGCGRKYTAIRRGTGVPLTVGPSSAVAVPTHASTSSKSGSRRGGGVRSSVADAALIRIRPHQAGTANPHAHALCDKMLRFVRSTRPAALRLRGRQRAVAAATCTGILAACTASTRPVRLDCEPAVGVGDESAASVDDRSRGASSPLPDLTLVLGGSEQAYHAVLLRSKADLPQSAVLYAVTPAPNRSGPASVVNDHTHEDADSRPQTMTVAPGGSTTDFVLSIPGAGWFHAQAIDPAGHIPPAAVLYAVSLESERRDGTASTDAMVAREEDAGVPAAATETAKQGRIGAEHAEHVEQAEQERLKAVEAEQERIAADETKQGQIAAKEAEQERSAEEQVDHTEQEQLAVEQAEQAHSAVHSAPPPSLVETPQLSAAEEEEAAAPPAAVHSAPPQSLVAAPQLSAAEEEEAAAPPAAVHSAPGVIQGAGSSPLTESQKSTLKNLGTGVLCAAVGMCALVNCK